MQSHGELRTRIEAWYSGDAPVEPEEFSSVFKAFVEALNRGEIRAAEPSEGCWRVNAWVKQGILLGFRWGRLREYSVPPVFRFYDKHTYPPRALQAEDGVRVVPGGTGIRDGSYLASGVVVMPPAYVNTGAWVGEKTMIDSHALVGSCAQVGARVHLSAAAQIGGVLEPVGALPVIVEDDVLIGGNCGLYEGTIVRRRAVIGAGTILTASIPVYDLVRDEVLRASAESPLVIPENAVVVPGSRRVGHGDFARQHGLNLACALIVKYRDEKTDASTALESALR